ncbi:MAG: alpha/beta hydrolase [Pseudomonadales bacterium]|jgi:pimeloyl-ACP methyl ester carboxylesterase
MNSSNQERPEWYQRALDSSSEVGDVTVDGCNVHYEVWGEIGKPGIVLIHGSNANLEWWRFVAPFLGDQFRVAAIDLSGNGDSGWRERYSGKIYADDVMAVCKAANLGEKPYIVAHSFGGFVGLEAGHYFGEQLGGIVFADFTVSPADEYTEWGLKAEERSHEPIRPTRTYEDREVALGRFRLVPEQPCQHPYIVDYLAQHALREVEGGWTWKFDPAMYDYLEMGSDQSDKFLGLKCKSALILGEHSTDEGALSAPYMSEITKGTLPIFIIPGTHHHFMFDEPMATVTAIKGILLTWISESCKA